MNQGKETEVRQKLGLLAESFQKVLYEEDTTLTVALVYRGTPENAKKFLDKQDEYFLNPEPDEETSEPDETSGGNDDIIQNANDIINGNADYYDVEEAVNHE